VGGVAELVSISVHDCAQIAQRLAAANLVNPSWVREGALHLTDDGRDMAYCAREIEVCRNAADELFLKLGWDEDLGQQEILDLGCGSGAYAVEFARRGGGFVFGVDVNEAYLTYAKTYADSEKVGNTAFVRGDVLALPFGHDVFDGVFVRNVLPYLPHGRALREVASRLRYGGWLCVITHGIAYYLGQFAAAVRAADARRAAIDLAVLANGSLHSLTGCQVRVGRKCQVFSTLSRLEKTLATCGLVVKRAWRTPGCCGMTHSWMVEAVKC